MSQCPGCNAVGCRKTPPTPQPVEGAEVDRHDLGSQATPVHLPASVAADIDACKFVGLPHPVCTHALVCVHNGDCVCDQCGQTYPATAGIGQIALSDLSYTIKEA